MIKSFLLDAEKCTAKPSSADGDDISGALDVESIELTGRSVNGANFCFVCDGEGRQRLDPVLSAVDSFGAPAIYGSFFVCNYDEEKDDFVSLSKKQTDLIRRYVSMYYDDEGKAHPQLECVDPPVPD